jgi:hypothetical protein
MGTTFDARQGMRIRYTQPADPNAASEGVAVLDQYRNL